MSGSGFDCKLAVRQERRIGKEHIFLFSDNLPSGFFLRNDAEAHGSMAGCCTSNVRVTSSIPSSAVVFYFINVDKGNKRISV